MPTSGNIKETTYYVFWNSTRECDWNTNRLRFQSENTAD